MFENCAGRGLELGVAAMGVELCWRQQIQLLRSQVVPDDISTQATILSAVTQQSDRPLDPSLTGGNMNGSRTQAVDNCSLVDDPTIRQPGLNRAQRQWSLLNRVCAAQGIRRANLENVGLESDKLHGQDQS